MLREIIEGAVAEQGDMEMIGFEDAYALEDAVTGDADVVIVGLDELEAILLLLEAHPRMTVIGILAEGREAVLYRTRPELCSLGELSTQGLVNLIRRAAQAAWTFRAEAETRSSS